jgi:hypothetical protein
VQRREAIDPAVASAEPLNPPPATPEPVAARESFGPAVPREPVAPTLSATRQMLRPIYDVARARGVHFGALINSACDIIDADETTITFGFKYPAHAARAAEKVTLEALTSIVAEVMNRDVKISCVHDPSVESWKQRETASRSPLVRAAQELGARVLSSEPED